MKILNQLIRDIRWFNTQVGYSIINAVSFVFKPVFKVARALMVLF